MRHTIAMLAVAAGAITLAGCGRSETAPAANGTTTIQQNANTMTVTTPQGTAQISTNGAGAPLPGGLPPYPNAVPGADIAGAAAGSQGRVVTFTTSDQPGQVLDFYTSAGQQAGMQMLSRTGNGPTAMLAFMHGNEAVSITATSGPGGTQVQIATGTR